MTHQYKTRSSFVLKRAITALFITSSFNALGATGGLPDSGSILQEIKPVPNTGRDAKPDVSIEPRGSSQASDNTPFKVQTIRIEGNSIFSTQTLHDLVADQEGKTLTLTQLNAIAARVTEYYQAHGYPLARAIVPAQTLSNATISIQVIEAKYGKVELNNKSRIRDSLLNATIAPLQSGTPVEEKTLDRTLLLLSDIPETQVNAKLKPGQETSTSDLDIDVSRREQTYANASVDNYGNKYIGRTRLNGVLNIVNPLRYGDTLSISGTTTGHGMDYVRLGYDSLINGQGTRTGVSYANVQYSLGDSASNLQAHGTADVGSIWIKHPVIRGKTSNVYTQLQYDDKALKDRIDASNLKTDRQLHNWMLSVSGDLRDNLLAGANSIWSVGLTAGEVRFKDTTAEQNDASTTGAKGGFSKWTMNFARLQGLNTNHSLYFNFAMQMADSNLDSSEKMSVGGPYTVRAYDVGAASGDKGYQTTLELRHELGTFFQGKAQASAFLDAAHVQVNNKPWSSSTDNKANLSGAGLGLNWNGPNAWKVNLYLAAKIGESPALIGNTASARAWLLVSKSY
jgi:hemolysin activation/secretion protein